MNVSSRHLNHIDGFSVVDHHAISSNYSMNMLANTGYKTDPITNPSSSRYMSNPISRKVVSTKKVNISIGLSITTQVRFSS